MNKVKVIITRFASDVQEKIDQFINENPNINIISVSGVGIEDKIITYLVYDEKIKKEVQPLYEYKEGPETSVTIFPNSI
jgi:hypothetical protein